MPRKYAAIWQQLKKVPVGQEVPVKCHATMVKTLKQAVMKEKSRETADLKRIGEMYAGKMEIRVEAAAPTGYVIVFFKLQWDGTRI